MEVNLEVFDEFLPREEFFYISNIFLGQEINWFWNPYVTHRDKLNDDPKEFQFTHIIFDANKGQVSPISQDVIDIFLNKLNAYVLLRIKANLNPNVTNVEPREYHTDFVGDVNKHSFTSIFYVNSNNGYTIFEDGTKVESVANRLITFPGYLTHTGTSCSDQKSRVVLNFNYFK